MWSRRKELWTQLEKNSSWSLAKQRRTFGLPNWLGSYIESRESEGTGTRLWIWFLEGEGYQIRTRLEMMNHALNLSLDGWGRWWDTRNLYRFRIPFLISNIFPDSIPFPISNAFPVSNPFRCNRLSEFVSRNVNKARDSKAWFVLDVVSEIKQHIYFIRFPRRSTEPGKADMLNSLSRVLAWSVCLHNEYHNGFFCSSGNCRFKETLDGQKKALSRLLGRVYRCR